MEMSFADRLGFAGLIMAFFSIAAAILWPDKKWIGWLSLVAAGTLLVWWLFLEIRTKIPNLYQNYPIRSTLLVFLFGGVFAVSIWLLLIRAPAPSSHQAEEKPKPYSPLPVSPNEPVEAPPQKDNPHSQGTPHKPTIATAHTQHPQPELKLRFAYSKHPVLVIENPSGVVARDIKWGVVLWNMGFAGPR